MVIGDRLMDDLRVPGRRSRGPSPNGHLSDDSAGSDDSDDNGMRIGEEYQSNIPDYNPDPKQDARISAMLVWAPHMEINDSKIDEYVQIAKEKHGYNTEQALGMLFWHKHNVEKALADLSNFTPFPDEWTVEDKVLFEQAFSFHGKSFNRIRQMLPDKSMSQLVKYYYSWKKTRSRTSLMDRQARKMTHNREESDEDIDADANSDSDFETTSKENGERTEVKAIAKPGPKSSQASKHGIRNKRKPPRGMFLKYDDLVALATGPPGQGEAILKQLDEEIITLKRQVQNNKQYISLAKNKANHAIDLMRAPEPTHKLQSRWTNEELLLAVQGVRKYGKDFKAIAEVIGNKLESHIQSFYINYQRRFNLDEVLAEYEKEFGPCESTKNEDDEENMEVEQSKTSTETPKMSQVATYASTKSDQPTNPANTEKNNLNHNTETSVATGFVNSNATVPSTIHQAQSISQSYSHQNSHSTKPPTTPLHQPFLPNTQTTPPILPYNSPQHNMRPTLHQPPALIRSTTQPMSLHKNSPVYLQPK